MDLIGLHLALVASLATQAAEPTSQMSSSLTPPTSAVALPASEAALPDTDAAPPTALSFAEAEARVRATSSLNRAAAYGVEAAEAQARAAAGLHRPTVSLDAQLIRYRKTFDISLSDALDQAQSDLGEAIPGLLANVPGLSGDILNAVGARLEAALPEIFSALPTDIRLRLDDTAFRPTVSVLQPIYSGGAIPALQRAAAANVDMAEARRKQAYDLESVNLARAYFGQVLAREALAIARDTQAGFDKHLRNARLMEAEGVISHSQTLQVELARDTAVRQVNRAAVEYDNAVASLANVANLDAGVTPTTPLFVNRDPVGPADVFISRAGRSNTGIAQAEATRDLAEAGVDVAAARFKPSVYAFGTYNMNPDNALPTEPDWAFGVGAHFTLMSSLDRRELVGAARAQASAASTAERQARDDARLLVVRAYNQADLARRQFLTMASSLAAAEENLRVQEISFREGEATAAAVIDARNLLGTARLQRAATAYEYDLSLAALLAASGNTQSLNDFLQRDDRISTP